MINIKRLFWAFVLLTLPVLWLSITRASITEGTLNNWTISQWLEVSLPCSPASVSNGSVNSNTCTITCNAGYDISWNSCILHQTSWWGGGGWGWGGWITTTPTCTESKLMCIDWKYELKSWVSCEWWNLGKSCGVSSWSNLSWSNLSGNDNLNWTIDSLWDIPGSPYSQEFNDAYKFAFQNGITTMKTIQEANMTGTLIRSHMAKMIVNYAIKILDKTPNTWLVCAFDDISNETSELKTYIKLSCQLWLMGIDMTSFYPSREVTRAEFGTILSRTIYGTKYNGWSPYYINHLRALQENNIITNINPDLQELRAYVMLMLMRAGQ